MDNLRLTGLHDNESRMMEKVVHSHKNAAGLAESRNRRTQIRNLSIEKNAVSIDSSHDGTGLKSRVQL
jgi:hypothetical protein